ncbi:MAG: GNAT family N-acetyltransferase [Thermomicrobiales bacterium]
MTASEIAVVHCTKMTEELRLAIYAAFPDLAFDAAESARFLADPDNVLFLAMSDSAVRGVAYGHRLQRLDQRRAEILLYAIDIQKEFRQRGIGSRLVAAVKAWGTEKGAAELWVLTERDNPAAMSLYRAAGGEEDSPNTTMFVFLLE